MKLNWGSLGSFICCQFVFKRSKKKKKSSIIGCNYSFQREETNKKVQDCKSFCQIFCIALSLFVVLSLVYMPSKETLRVSVTFLQHEWKFKPWNIRQFVLPDNDTQLLSPQSPCSGNVFLTIVVCSSVPNFNARQTIRDTWAQDASKLSNVRVVFLLGKSTNHILNAMAADESRKHSDIVQQDFLDTYNNLTIKSVMLLKWVRHQCANAKYVMKTDDDMFVHLPNLYRLLKAEGHEKLLMGCKIKGAVPIKNTNSKWFVPDGVYSEKIYPNYLSGTGYVMSRVSAKLLYETALETPFFYLEDIFITGICAAQVGLKPENNSGFSFSKRKNDYCVFKSLVTAHQMKPKELVQMWNVVQNKSSSC